MRMLLGALALAASFVHGAAHAGQVQTLYTSPPHQRIQAFAQDGELLAWFEPSASKCNAVWVWQLGSAKEPLPAQGAKFHNVTCRWQVPALSPVGLAIASNHGATAVLWTLREAASQALRFDYVLGATVANRNERRFQQVAHARHGAGLWLGGVAGGDGTLLYSVVQVQYLDQVACLTSPNKAGACDLKVAGGGIYRIVGRKPPLPVKGASPAVELSVAGGRVAFVPAAGAALADGRPFASGALPIEIRDVSTGARVASVAPNGAPIAVSLSTTVLAVLGHTANGLVLSWYSAANGKLLDFVTVPKTTAPVVAAGLREVVYRVGRSIRAVDIRTHRVRLVTKAAATPIGLSLAGNRLAWAEDVDGRGRIRAITLTP
jgi:hypothetical protein